MDRHQGSDARTSLDLEFPGPAGPDSAELLNNAPVGLSRIARDGTILWANRFELEMLGFAPNEYIGFPSARFHQDPTASDDMLGRVATGERLENYQCRLRHKDGSFRDVLINAAPVNAAGEFVYAHCFTRDITEWQAAREASRETGSMLSALVHSSPLPIVAFTVEGNITLWNEAAERLFGWTADEVLGHPIPFIPSGKFEEHRSMRARDLEGQGFSDLEVRRVRKDGTALDIRVSTVALRDSSHAIQGIMSVYVDISGQKRYERRLLAQNRVSNLLAAAPCLDEAIPHLLQALCEDLGWKEGIYWDVTPEGRMSCLARWPTAESPEPTPVPPVHIWESKQPVWSSVPEPSRAGLGFPVLSKGAVCGIFEFFSQQTGAADQDLIGMATSLGLQIGEFVERTRTQKQLSEREAGYRVLTETAADGILTIDAASHILFANSAAGRIFGYAPEELVGSNMTQLMPEALRQLHRSAFARYQETGIRHFSWQAVQLPGRHKAGHEISLEISFAEYHHDARRVFIGVVRDVTERKRFEAKIQETAKLESLGLLAGGIAHDFNNLLTGILGNVSLAADTLPLTHPANELLRHAAEASEQAANLTRQLLAYAGKGRFVIQLLDLSVVCRDIATLVKGSVPKNVQLRLDLAEHLPCIEADVTQIHQIIMNLVINGAEAIREGAEGTVLVTTGVQQVDPAYIEQTLGGGEIEPGRYVSLEVHDTGCGMDAPTIAKIFDPFFTTKFTGRGLGLAAVLGIVRGHKGAFKVYSLPGKGTTFKVLFPAVGAAGPEVRHEPRHPEMAMVGTVLVVDDESVIRQVTKSILERLGFQVLAAENGEKALHVLRESSTEITLVILDLTMPVMNGEEALREIKLLHPNLPIILSSGFNEMEAIQRFAGKGLAGFLQKPYTAARLTEKIQQVLGIGPSSS